MGVGDVSVDLGGADVGMAKEGLDGADVGAVHEEIGGERVAEGVGGDVFGDAGGASIFFDDTLDGAGSDAAKIAGGVDGLLVVGVVEEEGGKGIVANAEIVF